MALPGLPPFWAYLYLFILLLAIVSSLLILGLLLIKHHVSHKRAHSKNSILLLTYGAILMYISMAVSVIVSRLLYRHPQYSVFLNQISNLCWSIAQCFIYTLLLLRIHYTFTGTKYAVSKCIDFLFVFCTGCFMTCSVLYVYEGLAVEYSHSVDFDPTNGTMYAIGMEITSLLICTLLITLFVRKMMTVTVDMHRDLQTDPSGLLMDRRRRDRLNTEQRLLLNISAKCFILSIVAMIWTQIAISLMATAWYTGNDYVARIWGVFMFSDGIVDPICLFLIFECNHWWYSFLCHGCHAFAWLSFRSCAEKRVQHQQQRQKKMALRRSLLKRPTPTGSGCFGPGSPNESVTVHESIQENMAKTGLRSSNTSGSESKTPGATPERG